MQKENLFFSSSNPALAPSYNESASLIKDSKSENKEKEISALEEESRGDESSNEDIWKPIIK